MAQSVAREGGPSGPSVDSCIAANDIHELHLNFAAADVLAVQKRYSDFLSCQLDVPKFPLDISMATCMPSAGIDLDPDSGCIEI
jgi:hypothetical protein